MSANIKNFSSRLPVSLEKSIAEAVVNSIHANAQQITIKLYTQKNVLNSVSIIDNGDGFTQENLNSFFDLHSDHKRKIGGKGVGRATWYCHFNNVHIDSIFDEDGKWHLSFDLPENRKKLKYQKKNKYYSY